MAEQNSLETLENTIVEILESIDIDLLNQNVDNDGELVFERGGT